MTRMSRAGRKLWIKSVLRMAWRDNPEAWFSVGQIARKMGLKSSTYLKNVLREMEKETNEIRHADINGCDHWRYRPYEQQSFWEREIIVNGQRTSPKQYLHDAVQL